MRENVKREQTKLNQGKQVTKVKDQNMSEIMLAHMDMSRNTKEWRLDCKVYVGDLGYGAAKQELEDIFSQYGPLRNVWVARNPPGFAFVEYEDPRDAKDAVRGLNGVKINGRRVRVEMSTGESRWSKRGPPVGRRSSYRDSRPRIRSRSRSPITRRRRSPTPQSVSRSPSPYVQSASYGRR